jgi:dTDP-4-amino-4,6-dideoxygalactose transaminase
MAEMQPLLAIAAKHGIQVVEDAAQAIGAKALVDGRWQSAGAVGTLGCLSFYPTKNLGAWGDGGMVTTNDEGVSERLRRLRVHGENYERGRYVHDEVGTNSRLDAIQAAVLHVKLRHLPGWTETRRARAAWYDQRLASVAEIVTPAAEHDRFHIYSLYTVRAHERDALKEHLSQHGVGSGIYYPLPLHLQPCFADLGHQRGDFPEAERATAEVLSLPLYPELTLEEMERVAVAIAGFYAA